MWNFYQFNRHFILNCCIILHVVNFSSQESWTTHYLLPCHKTPPPPDMSWAIHLPPSLFLVWEGEGCVILAGRPALLISGTLLIISLVLQLGVYTHPKVVTNIFWRAVSWTRGTYLGGHLANSFGDNTANLHCCPPMVIWIWVEFFGQLPRSVESLLRSRTVLDVWKMMWNAAVNRGVRTNDSGREGGFLLSRLLSSLRWSTGFEPITI